MQKLVGIALAVIGAFAVSGIALNRGEPINALWILTAAVCLYTIGYRFYAAWITARCCPRMPPAPRPRSASTMAATSFRPPAGSCLDITLRPSPGRDR